MHKKSTPSISGSNIVTAKNKEEQTTQCIKSAALQFVPRPQSLLTQRKSLDLSSETPRTAYKF